MSNYNREASGKKVALPQVLGQQNRQFFSNFNPISSLSPFSPFNPVYGSPPQANTNRVLGFSPYPNHANFMPGVSLPQVAKNAAESHFFSKPSTFHTILRGLGSMAYNGRFSCKSQPLAALTPPKDDLPSSSSDE